MIQLRDKKNTIQPWELSDSELNKFGKYAIKENRIY